MLNEGELSKQDCHRQRCRGCGGKNYEVELGDAEAKWSDSEYFRGWVVLELWWPRGATKLQLRKPVICDSDQPPAKP